MTSGFFTGLVLGLALWAVVIWWHRSRLAKADKVWLDVIRTHQSTAQPKKRSKRRK